MRMGACSVLRDRLLFWTEHAPLKGSSVEDQHGRCVATYPQHLVVAVRKSKIQLQREVFCPRILSLVMSCESTMVFNADL